MKSKLRIKKVTNNKDFGRNNIITNYGEGFSFKSGLAYVKVS